MWFGGCIQAAVPVSTSGKSFYCLPKGRLCGGAHEISGIKAQHFLNGWAGVVWWVVRWGWLGGWCGGWRDGDGGGLGGGGSLGGFGVHGVLVRDVVGGGGRMGGGMGDGGEEGGCGVVGVLVNFEIPQGLRIFGHGGSRS